MEMRKQDWKVWLIPAVFLLHLSGCSGCNETPQAPLPVAQEGRLPKAPDPAAKTVVPAVSEPACVAIITPDTDEGPAPLTVTFTAEGLCTDAEGEFVWDFGDGTAAAKGTTASHVYEKPGEYTAKVTLSDPTHHVSDFDEILITVTPQ